MNENENNFTSLKRLLAFKNRETPPPGYFNDFSRQVVARIRAGEVREPATAAERLMVEAPWLVKFLQIFEAKPAFAGAFAFALCLVLVFGIVSAERPDVSAPQPLLQAAQNSSASLADASPAALAVQEPASQILLASDSTNPVTSLEPVSSLFSQQNSSPSPFAQEVSFSLPSN